MAQLTCSSSHARPLVQGVVIKSQPTGIPVIDLSRLQGHGTKRSAVVQEIDRACRQLGCFQVVNHGVCASVTSGALSVASKFFELPEKEREIFASDDIKRPVRYSVNSLNEIDRVRSTFRQYAYPPGECVQHWPLNPPTYREKMAKYATEVRRVALQVLGAIFESLGLAEGYMKDSINGGMQMMTVNSYPPTPRPDIAIGLPPHTDFGYITIILQSCQGLQVNGTSREGWIDVRESPSTLHIHTGDYLEVLSNGRYKSLIHRATLSPAKGRISIASIHGPPIDAKVETAEALVDDHHPRMYRESNFHDYLDHLLANDKSVSFLDTLRMSEHLNSSC